MTKYKYNINNLDCANCARKIEETLNNYKDMKNVVVNFNTAKLSYESDKEISISDLNKLIKKIEPDASVSTEEINTKKEFHISIILAGLTLGLLGYFLNISNVIKIILYIIAYSLLLYRTTINAIKLLFQSKTINENLLITISCIGALLIGEILEGMMVIILYSIGKILEERAINNSRKSIKNLIDIKQPYANKKYKNYVKKIDVEKIKIGDILIIKKGEKIPVDGIVIKGKTRLDTSMLNGEVEPSLKSKNDSVLSGCINLDDVIEIKATSCFEDSTVYKILELVENATDKKTKTETIVSKISKVYTPLILIFSILMIIFLPLFEIPIYESIYRALTFLVISCPCAIAISVPLSYFIGIGVSSREGILIKGSNYLDNLSNVKNIIFDKTGTLTNGSFNLSKIDIIDNNYQEDELLNILLKGESLSNHPIAKSINSLSNKKINNKDVQNYKEIDGKGISFDLNNNHVLIGNKELCGCNENVTIHLNINNCHVASIYINDGIKDNAKETIDKLKQMGIKTYMFTGDKRDVALNIGNKLGLDEIKYEMLPTDKFESYEQIASDKEITIFVGDGINDAPVLKRADIGISMGSIGTDSAIEASDVVLISDELAKIPEAIYISKYTKKVIKQNLILAISVKVLILILSVLGLANMWLAVFADTGLTLFTILNSLKILKKGV